MLQILPNIENKQIYIDRNDRVFYVKINSRNKRHILGFLKKGELYSLHTNATFI